MASRMSLQSFLATAKKTLLGSPASTHSSPLTFVVGNESADLDSLCSAVVYAYLRSNSPPHTLHIPLSNLPRPDLSLRPELTAVLQHAGLRPSDLLTLSELPDLEAAQTRWILVDHNSMTSSLKRYKEKVIGCVDHHVDEGSVNEKATPRRIETCGSCMSLVIEETKDAWDAISKAGDSAEEDNNLVQLALAPILIDTNNMTDKSKVRAPDENAFVYLKQKLSGSNLDTTSFFENISSVKEDIGQLNFRDIFRKDYKEWDDSGLTLGISSIVQDFDFLLEKAGDTSVFVKELESWAEERSLDLCALMTTSTVKGEFQRHILVWARSQKAQAALEKFVDLSTDLELEGWGDGKLDDGSSRVAWRQHNLAASRKKVAPLLRQAMKDA